MEAPLPILFSSNHATFRGLTPSSALLGFSHSALPLSLGTAVRPPCRLISTGYSSWLQRREWPHWDGLNPRLRWTTGSKGLVRLTLWQSDHCCALGGRLTLRRYFLGGDSDQATSLDSIWCGSRHQPLPMRQGHWWACTDVYCLATPKKESPQWIRRAAIRHLDSSAGQVGFQTAAIAGCSWTWSFQLLQRGILEDSGRWRSGRWGRCQVSCGVFTNVRDGAQSQEDRGLGRMRGERFHKKR